LTCCNPETEGSIINNNTNNSYKKSTNTRLQESVEKPLEKIGIITTIKRGQVMLIEWQGRACHVQQALRMCVISHQEKKAITKQKMRASL
jgi:hypothetical protein